MSRLVTPLASGDDRAQLASGEANDRRAYLERVAKYVPAEVLAAYTALLGFFGAVRPDWQVPVYWAGFAVCLAATPLYLSKMGRQSEPKQTHLVVSSIAFVVWAYSIGGPTAVFGPDALAIYDPGLAGAAMVIFTLVSGLVIPRQKSRGES